MNNPYLIPEDDVQIDVRGLFRDIRKHLLQILIVGVVFACLVMAYKYFNFKKTVLQSVQTQGELAPETEGDLEGELESYQAQSEAYRNSLARLQDRAAIMNDYQTHSIMMQLDPYDVPTVTTNLIITTRYKDKTIISLIVEEMTKDLLQGAYLKDLADKADTGGLSYLKELFSVASVPLTAEGNILTLANGTGGEDAAAADDTAVQNAAAAAAAAAGSQEDDTSKISRYEITLDAYGLTEDQAGIIMDGLLDEAGRVSDQISQRYEFTMRVGETRSYAAVNTNIVNQQIKFLNNMNTSISTATNIQKAQDAMEASADDVSAVTPAGTPAISKKGLVKYGIIGFAAGIILMLLFYIIRFITNDKIRTYADLKERFRLRDMGHYDRSDLSVEMIDANIRNYVPKAEGSLLLTGGVDTSVLGELKAKLEERDPSRQIVTGGDFLKDPKTRRMLAGADSVVLVEKAGDAKLCDLAAETEVISSAKKEIAGIVIC